MQTSKVHPLEQGIVSIQDAGGETKGSGFVVLDNTGGLRILTCAHVVNRCAQRQQPGVRPEWVTVVFLANPEEQWRAYVEPECWRDRNRGDLASLRIEGSIPPGVGPLPMGSALASADHQLRSYGFPEGHKYGVWAKGTVVGIKNHDELQVIQLESPEISRGFSGAPVWDEERNRVIGMVNNLAIPDNERRLATTAFAISTDTLWAVCPALRHSDEPPYQGLAAFTQDHACFFFGRDRVINSIREKLHGKPQPALLVLLGPSGSGKSSLIQAGLIPGLEQGATEPVGETWKVLLTRPSDRPFVRFEEEGLEGASKGLLVAVRNWQKSYPQSTRLLLVMDQAEQIFTEWPESERSSFFTELGALVREPSELFVTIMLVVRDDFFSSISHEVGPRVSEWERRIVSLSEMLVLNQEELGAIIAKPAARVGLAFESGLVAAIVKDTVRSFPAPVQPEVSTTPAASSLVLPFLESTLTRLWDMRHEGLLTRKAYDYLEGVTGTLGSSAERVYGELEEDDKLIAQCVFLDLVHVGNKDEGTPNIRRRRLLAEICPARTDRSEVRRVVRSLAGERLLLIGSTNVPDEEPVEIIHDALLRHWTRLKQWLEEDPDFMEWRQDLAEKVNPWVKTNKEDRKKRSKDLLIRGKELETAEDWLNKRWSDLGIEERAFINASRTRRQQRRIAGRVMASLIVGVSLVVISWVILREIDLQRVTQVAQVNDAQSRSAIAINQIQAGNLEEGLHKAMEAVSITQQLEDPSSSQAETALHLALVSPPPREHWEFDLHQAGVHSAAYNPTSTYIVTAGYDHMAYILNARTGTISQTLRVGEHAVTSAAFSPDGAYVVTSATSGRMKIWDAGKGVEARPAVHAHRGAVWTAAYHPKDNNRIVTAGNDDKAYVWDAVSGKAVFTMTANN